MMADVGDEGCLATVGESPTQLTTEIGVVADDVFANGDDNVATDSNLLHAGYGTTAEQILPRKSSLIKDSSRGSRRKKTVSFSSMPGERTVVNGEFAPVFDLPGRFSVQEACQWKHEECFHCIAPRVFRFFQNLAHGLVTCQPTVYTTSVEGHEVRGHGHDIIEIRHLQYDMQ